MAGQLLLPLAHCNDTTLNLAGECAPSPSQGLNLDRIAIKPRGQPQEDIFQIISQRFPEAKEFLKERLAISIGRRRTRLSDWRQQYDEAKILGNKSRILTELESKQCGEVPESKTGLAKSIEATRWENQENFPKPPEIESSQSHFLCQICYLSVSSEEAKGDLWTQHVTQDLAPHICLLESCQSPQTAFSSFEDWLNHTKEEGGSISDVFAFCPLCSYQSNKQDGVESSTATTDQEVLRQHIASHLQSLALTSLPLLPSDGEARAESSEPSINVIRAPLQGAQPMAPFGHQLDPDLKFYQRHLPRGLEPTITSIPESFQKRYLPQNGATRHPTSRQAWRPHEGQNTDNETFDVLVAEDNMINQKIFFLLLQKRHHTVVIVNNGQEAFDAVKQRKYDIILMDISMPVMGGLEATGRIREYERHLGLPRTPVIGLSASAMRQDAEQMLKAEMDDFLSKPVSFAKLTDVVLHYGRLGRCAARSDINQFLALISGGEAALRCSSRDLGAKL